MSERAVEFGWAAAQRPSGNVLDAGSTFNHSVTLDSLLPSVDSLTIVTLAPEKPSFPERGIQYLYSDLRALPFPNATFDTVLSISVLEHVGLDTGIYGWATAQAADPHHEALRAVRELGRVTKPGGQLLLSVPFGVPCNLGWVRVMSAEDFESLVDAAAPRAYQLAVFRDCGTGWQHATMGEAASARYETYSATAVVCARLEF